LWRRGRFRLRGALGALQLGLDLLRELGELLQDLDRLVRVVRLVQPLAGSLQPRQQMLCVVQ
jgi:hypothetical protein